MDIKAELIKQAAVALETAMKQPAGSCCTCILGELFEDFSLAEINAIIRYQARLCTLASMRKPGGDYRANTHLVHLLERREQLELTDIFEDEILEN